MYMFNFLSYYFPDSIHDTTERKNTEFLCG